MRSLLKCACFGGIFAIVAAVALLTAPAALAFTMENGDGKGGGASSGGTGTGTGSAFAVPKWDLEEQARQFQSGSSTTSTAASNNQFSTPFGNGTLQFGVQPHNFSSPTGSAFGGQSSVTRQNFDRMLAPPGLQHLYDQ